MIKVYDVSGGRPYEWHPRRTVAGQEMLRLSLPANADIGRPRTAQVYEVSAAWSAELAKRLSQQGAGDVGFWSGRAVSNEVVLPFTK